MCDELPSEPRRLALVQVLMAGFALRAINDIHAMLDSGLTAALLLLDILAAEAESASLVPRSEHAPPEAVERGRSTLNVSRSTGVPRETVRRLLLRLAETGWLESCAGTRYRSTMQARGSFALAEDGEILADFIWTASAVHGATTRRHDIETLVARHPWHVALSTRRDTTAAAAWHDEIVQIKERLNSAPATVRQSCGVIANGYLDHHLKGILATFGRDLMFAPLIGEIAHRNICRLAYHGGAGARLAHLDHLINRVGGATNPLLMPVNSYSLAVTMGIPDATLRRKIVKLVRRGWVVREAGGSLSVNARAVRAHSVALDTASLQRMLGAYRELQTFGVTAGPR